MGLSLYRAPPLYTGSLPQKYMVLALAILYKALAPPDMVKLVQVGPHCTDPLPSLLLKLVHYDTCSDGKRAVRHWNAFLFHVFRFCVPELAADCLATFPLLPGPSADNLYLSRKQRICGFNADPVEAVLLILEQITKGLRFFSTQNGKRSEEILSIVVVERIHVIFV